MTTVQAVLNGDRLALARLLTQVENDTQTGREALDELFAHTGRAHVIGITGAPGTGKSSLVSQLARAYRQQEPYGQTRVAIIAIDPTSPFTGGAVLGDRVRMRDLAGDPGVFVRSMATRGALGGLARTTSAAAQVFDAAGYDVVLIETVGAGQTEVDIARLADTTVVIEAPGLGDDIQAIKAGILEIADILVVNKADRPGVENAEQMLRSMLEFSRPGPTQEHGPHGEVRAEDPCAGSVSQPETLNQTGNQAWVPPILRTTAISGCGIQELLEAIQKHAEYLHTSGRWRQRDSHRIQAEFDERLAQGLLDRWRAILPEGVYQKMLEDIEARKISPFQAAQILLSR
jgi:LAO/AO transport system kinase